MKLELHERMALLQLIPPSEESSYEGIKAMRRAREILNFTPDELKYYEIKQVGGRYNWNLEKAQSRVLDAPIEEYIIDLVRRKLSEMERGQKLSEQYLSVYEKFVIAYMSVEP